jgi:hypothetical protein
MHSPSAYLLTAFWIVVGIMALLWTIPCGAIATWGEKQGVSFRKVFTISIFLSPLAGVIFVWIARPARVNAALAQTASRG